MEKDVTYRMSRRRAAVRIRHRLEYVGWLSAAFVLRWLPRRATVALADAMGWLLYRVLRVRRAVVEENLRRAFGRDKSEAELQRIALESYRHAVLTFCEFIQPKCAGAGARELFEQVEGECFLESFRGRRAIFLTAHIGNWELLGHAVRSWGFELDAVLKPLHNPFIDQEVTQRRAAAGFRLIPTTGNLRGIVSAVREGRYPVFLADQDARRGGLFVEFFGHPASTPAGPAYFAVKLGVPILVGFSVRNRNARRTLSLLVGPPLEPNPQAPFDDEVMRLTREHVRRLEEVVRRYPESYFWMHRRWKTKPRHRDGREVEPSRKTLAPHD